MLKKISSFIGSMPGKARATLAKLPSKLDLKGLFVKGRTALRTFLSGIYAKYDPKDPAKRKKAIRLILVVAAFFIIYSQLKGCVTTLIKTHNLPVKPVETALVTKKDVPVYIYSFGNMATLNNTDVRSQVTGKIIDSPFTEGAEVNEGDLLFAIDPSLYKAALDQALAAVQQDQDELKLKTDLLERNRPLSEKGLISKQDFERLETDVATATARLQLDQASAEQANINLNYCSIKAPISGVTGKRLVDIGNIVPANTGPVLVNLKTIDELYVDFTIAERDFQNIRDASAQDKLKVLITPQYTTSTTDEGELIFLDNAVDLRTGTVALRAIVKNKDRSLWPGQFVKIAIILATEKGALTVPSPAVQFGQKGPYLFVVKSDMTADLRFVELGPSDGGVQVIKSGVQDGETVVTSGQLQLKPGTKVQDAAKLKEKAEKGRHK